MASILEEQEQNRLLNQQLAGRAHQTQLNQENQVMREQGVNRQQAQRAIKQQGDEDAKLRAMVTEILKDLVGQISITGDGVTGGNGVFVIE